MQVEIQVQVGAGRMDVLFLECSQLPAPFGRFDALPRE